MAPWAPVGTPQRLSADPVSISGQRAPATRPLPAIDRSALDEAVRRFPAKLAQWRRHGVPAIEIHALAPRIVAEYRLIMATERRNRSRSG